jgi:competence protein ComEC
MTKTSRVVPHAGERWRLTVRLKAPHGNRNPHGFDSELWMWEQGVHASGYVRTGTRDEAPARLQATWRHPVERAREAVRDAVFARVPDRAQAGVIAALVTGDQSAIDRAGWEVFRATGVAHLMRSRACTSPCSPGSPRTSSAGSGGAARG